jgi:M6 family metalloprotease-like protein
VVIRHRHCVGGVGFRLPLSIPVAAGLAVLILVMVTGMVLGDTPAQASGGPRGGKRLQLRSATAGEHGPAPLRTFPDRLFAFGPRSQPTFAPQGWHPRAPLPRGNAVWEPSSPIAPSVLSARRRAAAAALTKTRDAREFLHTYDAAKAAATPDTVRILLLRIDFLKDSPGSKSTGDGRFDLRRDAASRAMPIDPPPHDRNYFAAHMEALSRYYAVQSGGALVLKWDIYPAETDSAYHLADTRKYGPWVWSNSNPDVFVHIMDFAGDALAAADADPTLDFTVASGDSLKLRYDSIILFHAGADLQGDLNGDSPWDIPSLNLWVQEPFVVQDSTAAINFVQIVPETVNQDGFWGALNGVVTHEFGHQLGFDDLYDVATGGSMVGAFSLMDSGESLYGVIEDPADPNGILPVRGPLPGSVDPWHKIRFFPDGVDLVTPERFVSGDSSHFEIALPSVQLPLSEGGNRILYLPLNLSEYLLVENRVWDLNGDSLIVLKSDKETGVILGPVPADTLAPASDYGYREYDYLLPAEGIIAWHIDNLAIETGINTPYGGVNIYFSRPGVAVLEADGIRDIGTASNEYIGGPYDTWYQGGYTRLGPETVPSSRTNDGTPTGLSMTALDPIGVTARVAVEIGLGPAGWPVVMPGAPREEQFLTLPVSRDTTAILVASGNKVYAWGPGGCPLFGPCRVGENGDVPTGEAFTFDLPIEQGLAGMRDAATNPAGDSVSVLAVVAGGRLQVRELGSERRLRLSWPPGAPGTALGDSLVTATPVFNKDLVWVGCGDGTIRAFDQRAGTGRALAVPAGTGAVRVLGVGYLQEEGAESDQTCFWATDRGESGAASWSGPGHPSHALFHAEQDRPGVTPAGVLAVANSAAGPPRIMFAWSDGWIEWRTTGGALLPGWPASIGTAPAGSPIVCDADGDGVLETVVAGTDGRVHCLGANGTEEFGWPRSLWSEDERQPPAQVLGVRALDLDGAGGPEILVQRTDGFLVAFDGRGEKVPGWPRALGADARLGPEWIPAGRLSGARLAYAGDHGLDPGIFSPGADSIALGVTRVDGARGGAVPGAFPSVGFDASRTRAYPAALIPGPVEVPVDGPRASLRLYPNPLRGDQLTLRFTLARPARVQATAYDLSGRRVAQLEAPGQPGPDGNHLPWDWGQLASGLYQVRVRFFGEGWSEEMIEKVAVLR